MVDSYVDACAYPAPSQSASYAAPPSEGFEGAQGNPYSNPAPGAPSPSEGYEGGQGNHPAAAQTSPPPAAHSPGDASAWPEPLPLKSGLLPVAELTPEHIPEMLVPFIGDIADRMQCAPDFVAAAVLTALGSTIGTRLAIRPKQYDDWIVRPNLWCMIVGRPGVMKSPAVSEAISPLMKLEATERLAHDKDALARSKEADIYKARRRAYDEKLKKMLASNPNAQVYIEPPIEPPASYPRRFIANDTTYEALGEIAARNKEGILVHRDELMSLLMLLDREENIAARGFYLTGWDGNQSYRFDRIMRGATHVERLCLSMLGTTQPGRLTSYIGKIIKGGGADDGLLQRFGLIVFPDHSKNWRYVDRPSDMNARNNIEAMFSGILTCDLTHFRPEYDRNGQPYLTYTSEASADFVAWLTHLQYRLCSDELHPMFVSHIAKYPKLVPALSLVFHIANNGVGPVSQYALQRAIAYSEYLETHAQRAYAAGINMGDTAATLIATRLRKGDIPNGFTLRDIHQKDWSGLTDRDQVEAGIEKLCDVDWLRASIVPTGGRSKVIYMINPRILAR